MLNISNNHNMNRVGSAGPRHPGPQCLLSQPILTARVSAHPGWLFAAGVCMTTRVIHAGVCMTTRVIHAGVCMTTRVIQVIKSEALQRFPANLNCPSNTSSRKPQSPNNPKNWLPPPLPSSPHP